MTSDSPRTFNTGPKKYTASLNANNAGRSLHTRQRLLSTKISAPLPINLPSLKSESGMDGPAAAHSWGTSASPEITHVQPVELPVARAWALPSQTTQVEPPAPVPQKKPDEDIKEMHEATRISWDEMLDDEQDEFSVDVIEFEDGTKFPLNEVTPSERFTEDYDRGDPTQLKPTPPEEPLVEEIRQGEHRRPLDKAWGHEEHHRHSQERAWNHEERRRSQEKAWGHEEHHRHPQEKVWNHEEYCKSQEKAWGHEERSQGDRSWSHEEHRRSQDKHRGHEERGHGEKGWSQEEGRRSHDKPWAHEERCQSQDQHETRRISGDIGWEDSRRGLSAVQKGEHMSVLQKGPCIAAAAERAQKRREEQEAQYEAARERARQKAEKLKLEQQQQQQQQQQQKYHPGNLSSHFVRAREEEKKEVGWPYQTRTLRKREESKREEPVTIISRAPSEVLWWDSEISQDTRPNMVQKESLANWTLDLPPVPLRVEPPTISILQHERNKKEPVGSYRDKIQAMLRNHTSPVFSQAIHKTIADKPKHLSFMFENTTKKDCFKSKTMPTMLYRFPAGKKTDVRGVYLMPTPLAMNLDRNNLSSQFPLPRQMIINK
ncbi:hypothetical protein BY458DRAFT_525178 [Sporodiniella umbellata]|nr:hypothetical protein BY458DRAFT_525178 [Sporodiniella umbellata]